MGSVVSEQSIAWALQDGDMKSDAVTTVSICTYWDDRSVALASATLRFNLEHFCSDAEIFCR
jgi:hypothetical protein